MPPLLPSSAWASWWLKTSTKHVLLKHPFTVLFVQYILHFISSDTLTCFMAQLKGSCSVNKKKLKETKCCLCPSITLQGKTNQIWPSLQEEPWREGWWECDAGAQKQAAFKPQQHSRVGGQIPGLQTQGVNCTPVSLADLCCPSPALMRWHNLSSGHTLFLSWAQSVQYRST